MKPSSTRVMVRENMAEYAPSVRVDHASVRAVVEAIAAVTSGDLEVAPLQSYLKGSF